MFVRQVTFDLNDSAVDRDVLREYLRSGPNS
jgi:hypothetical protein